MTSRSDRLRAFIDVNGPFEGSVADLAGEMDDPSPNALSACVSVAIKEGWLRRHPATGGTKAEWLWLASQPSPVVDAGLVEAAPEPAALVVSEPAPIEPVAASEPAVIEAPPEPVPLVHSAPARGSALRMVEPEPCVEGPSPMRITLDVAPWQIRIEGKAVTVREAKALVRDLQTALRVVEA